MNYTLDTLENELDKLSEKVHILKTYHSDHVKGRIHDIIVDLKSILSEVENLEYKISSGELQ